MEDWNAVDQTRGVLYLQEEEEEREYTTESAVAVAQGCRIDNAHNKNQAELVPGPEPDKIKNFKIFFQKIKPTTMPVHHVKGQPGAPTYVQKKGVSLLTLIVKHPV